MLSRIKAYTTVHWVAAAVLSLTCTSSQAKPLVLSSLKPLTLIAQEVTGTTAEVDTLLPVSGSHHDYPLKVSDHARLQQADVFLWVGPELESFLQKPVATLASAKVIAAYDLAGIHWPAAEQHAADKHHHANDPHLWLDPRNAVIVATALTQRLAVLDAKNASDYRANLAVFAAKMNELDKSLAVTLKPVMGVGFAVYHEGFAHFVGHYGLRQLDYVTLTPEQKPGAKHLHELRERLSKDGSCLFLEPYNNMQATRDLAQELNLRVGTLNALGTETTTSYSQLLQQLASDFLACLTNSRR